MHINKFTTGKNRTFENKDIAILLCFFVSAINAYVAIGFAFIGLAYFSLRKDSVGLLKTFAMYVLRVSAMNHVLFRPVDIGAVKYAVMLGFALAMIIVARVQYNNLKKLNVVATLLGVYFIYVFMSSLINSSYPIVSVLKLFLFVVAFYSVLRTVAATAPYFDWLEFFKKWYTMIFVLCIISIPIMRLRTKNGHALQGIFDHPNVFAIYGAFYICLLLLEKKKTKFDLFMIFATYVMLYLSESRTGMFSALFITLVYFLVEYRYRMQRIVFAFLVIVLIVMIIYVLFPGIFNGVLLRVQSFIWKSANEDILYSRNGQIDRFHAKFAHSPYLGTGFMTPFELGYKQYSMSFDLYVEQGNLFFAILGETGIIGLFFWLLLYGFIFIKGNKKNLILFITPIVISMGEMVFFSTNSMGTLFYVLFAVYLFQDPENVTDDVYEL